jgi:predicted O-methyltransferase YrrM
MSIDRAQDVAKKSSMISFWSERARAYETDPRANTNDIWLREVEIAYVARILGEHSFGNVLDFGCANGYSTTRLAKLFPAMRFTGVDINEEMIRIAETFPKSEGLSNLEFRVADVVEKEITEKYDFIFTIRVFQNIESVEMQKKVFDALHECLADGGMLLTVESYADGYRRINEDREKLGLTALPIHPHLTLVTDEFDDHVTARMEFVRHDYLSATYYLITRLLYSYIAKVNEEPIDYNHPIHQVASMMPQVGEYGVQKAMLFRKRQA